MARKLAWSIRSGEQFWKKKCGLNQTQLFLKRIQPTVQSESGFVNDSEQYSEFRQTEPVTSQDGMSLHCPQSAWWYIIMGHYNEENGARNMAIAAFTTCNARLKLSDMMKKLGIESFKMTPTPSFSSESLAATN